MKNIHRFLLYGIGLLSAGIFLAAARPAPRPAAAPAGRPWLNPRQPIRQRVAELLARMTLKEKLAQLYPDYRRPHSGGKPVAPQFIDTTGTFTPAQATRAMRELFSNYDHLSPRRSAILRNAMQRYQIEKTRLGIPQLIFGEALHGFMEYDATSFPNPMALASTFDTHLIRQDYRAAGDEARSAGVDQVFAPDLDLARDPRWGRVEETFGEDPYLVARMGVAEVLGLQGRNFYINHHHVLATAKHFIHGQPEGGRNTAPSNISERTLREYFMEPFKAVVQRARVGSIMASYNEINSIPSHVNYWLLTRMLRQRWGFQGFVTSDGGALPLLVTVHHVARDYAQAAREALRAGVDYELGYGVYKTLYKQAKAGIVPMSEINRAAGLILAAKFRLGLFNHPYVNPAYAARITNDRAHRVLALRSAEEAITLLKNQGSLLPLDAAKIKTIAVIGPNATGVHLGGYARGAGPGHGVSVLAGIRAAAGPGIKVLYSPGCVLTQIQGGRPAPVGWNAFYTNHIVPVPAAQQQGAVARAVATARRANVAVVVIGDNESMDREAWSEIHLGDSATLRLLPPQNELVRKIVATGTPTVVVFIEGRPLQFNWIKRHVPAILMAWFPGEQGGAALGKILFGQVNPSGHLPVSIARSVGMLPVYYNHKPSLLRNYQFVKNGPLYPFGYGLSYTTFRFSHLQIVPDVIHPAGTATVSVNITNTGRRAGTEVAQMYIHQLVATVTQPVEALKGFARVHLRPGQTKTVHFRITPRTLAILGLRMKRVVQPGIFDIKVGDSSVHTLSGPLTVARDGVALPAN